MFYFRLTDQVTLKNQWPTTQEAYLSFPMQHPSTIELLHVRDVSFVLLNEYIFLPSSLSFQRNFFVNILYLLIKGILKKGSFRQSNFLATPEIMTKNCCKLREKKKARNEISNLFIYKEMKGTCCFMIWECWESANMSIFTRLSAHSHSMWFWVLLHESYSNRFYPWLSELDASLFCRLL